MSKINQSILDAISSTIPEKDKLNEIENRSSHALASAINFLNTLKENFTPEEAEELSKRFVNAIRTDAPEKFYRGLRHLKEQKENIKESNTKSKD